MRRASKQSRMRIFRLVGWGCALCLALCLTLRAQDRGVQPARAGTAPVSKLWGGLKPGRHAVGLKLLPLVSADNAARRVKLVLWYPASAAPGAVRLKFADYLQLTAAQPRDPAELRRLLSTAISGAPSADIAETLLDQILATPLQAVREARPAVGRYPLVLWSARHATEVAQSVLSEYLASHGFIVAYAHPEPARPLPYEMKDAETKRAVLEEQVRDLRFAFARLRRLPGVARGQAACLAWSYAGESALRLQLAEPQIGMVIGLSSNVLSGWVYQTPEALAQLDAASLKASYALLTERVATDGTVRTPPPALEQLAGSYFITFPELAHGNFNTTEGLLPGLLGITQVPRWSKAGAVARTGYETVARLTRELLEGRLKQQPEKLAALEQWPQRQSLPPAFVQVTKTDARILEQRIELQVDGWRIIGDFVKPRAARPVPAVLLLNKAAGNRQVYAGLAAQLAARGVASLRLDLRGHGESVNLGKFDPNAPPEQRLALADEDHEIAAATRYLRGLAGIDGGLIGYVGASYSGEMMMVAARQHGYGQAYVALSPGSFSTESFAAIDTLKLPFLFVRSTHERSRVMQEFYTNLRQHSRTAQFVEVNGAEHATDVLTAHPELAELLAVWLARRLSEPARKPE